MSERERDRERETLIIAPFRSSFISVEFFANLNRSCEKEKKKKKNYVHTGRKVWDRAKSSTIGKIYPSSNHTRPDYISRRFFFFSFYSPFLSLYINFGTDLRIRIYPNWNEHRGNLIVGLTRPSITRIPPWLILSGQRNETRDIYIYININIYIYILSLIFFYIFQYISLSNLISDQFLFSSTVERIEICLGRGGGSRE